MSKTTFTNQFHGSSCNLMIDTSKDSQILTKSQASKIRGLCGMSDCDCPYPKAEDWIIAEEWIRDETLIHGRAGLVATKTN